MDKWDINLVECGKFILTEQKDVDSGNIKNIAGSYENGYFDGKKDVFYCKRCAERYGVK